LFLLALPGQECLGYKEPSHVSSYLITSPPSVLATRARWHREESTLKRYAILLLKIGVSVGLLAYLIIGAREAFDNLRQYEKNWPLVGLAVGLCLTMVGITFVRWWLLVRVLDVPFRLADAIRLGFLGYLFNFVSLGNVGGDLFKAIFIAREQPGRRTLAVASVVVDRIVGLYALFLVAAATVLVTGAYASPEPEIRSIAATALVAAAASTAGLLLVLTPGVTEGRFARWVAAWPGVGAVAARALGALAIYRRRWPALVLATAMSFGVHASSTLCIFTLSRALPGEAPGLAEHFLIVPLSILAGALPLPLSGLGAMEAVMEFLYMQSPGVVRGTGLVVSLAFRAVTLVVAGIGLVYYLGNRAQVARAMRAAPEADCPAGESSAEENSPPSLSTAAR